MCLYLIYYKVHKNLLGVQERSLLERDHHSKTTAKLLRQNNFFLPAENGSSVLKVSSLRLSTDAIY